MPQLLGANQSHRRGGGRLPLIGSFSSMILRCANLRFSAARSCTLLVSHSGAMLATLSLRGKILGLVGALLLCSFPVVLDAGAQAPGRYGGGRDSEQQGPPGRAPSGEPIIDGVSVGAGLAIYQGDFSRNPNHNIVKYLAGNGKLAVRVGADHRLGRYDQYGLGADVVYNRLSGETTGDQSFQADIVMLDVYADYELPYIAPQLFRLFIGGGPNYIISPSYKGFPPESSENNYSQLGSRVEGSVKLGVTILDQFRIGTRIFSSDLIDGYKGLDPDGIPDVVSFINLSYRFEIN